MINCLVNSGGRPLTTAESNALYRAARELARDKKKRLKIDTCHCKGTISTEWKSGSMGTISGIEFKAEVVVASGETEVTFLVRNFDLEEMEWQGYRSIEEVDALEAKLERSRLPRDRRKLN